MHSHTAAHIHGLVEQLTAGAGSTARVGDTVLFDYVLRRANGYFIVVSAAASKHTRLAPSCAGLPSR